jgi:NAD(P)-dependent dehydrogenase (short-subunit alcohol dehydrogenase family)
LWRQQEITLPTFDIPTMEVLSWCAYLAALVALVPYLVEFALRREFYVHSSDGIVITTGTSTGIGRAACGYLAERHTAIAFFCGVRNTQDGTGHPFTLENVVPVLLDVTNQSQVDSVIADVEKSGMPLIGVFNNAGVAQQSTIEFLELEEYRWTGRAAILPRSTAYMGAKQAVEVYGDVLRRELESHGVSVSMIEPGFVRSEITENIIRAVQEMLENGIQGEEMKLYPKLYNPTMLKQNLEILAMVAPVEETCQAIEEALFSKYPKSRYVTAVMGPLPAWLLIRFVENILPDRLTDLLIDNCKPGILIHNMKEYVRGVPGALWR